MGISMILLGLAGLIFSSAGARLVSDKIAEVGATEEFSGLELRRNTVQGLRRLNQGADVDEALLDAVQRGDAVEVQRLLDAGANPDCLSSDGNFTPLILAAAGDHTDVIRILLNGGAAVELRNEMKISALEFASFQGSVGALRVLLAAGGNPNEFDCEGMNPVHRAARQGHAGVVKELVGAGGSISLRTRGSTSGDTALHLGAQDGHLGVVKLLLRLGAEVDAENTKYHQTPMDRAAARDTGSILLALIQAGGDVSHVDIDGDSPLFVAAYFGNREAIEVLVENGADRSLANKKDIIPRAALCQCMFAPTVVSLCQVKNCTVSTKRMISLLNP